MVRKHFQSIDNAAVKMWAKYYIIQVNAAGYVQFCTIDCLLFPVAFEGLTIFPLWVMSTRRFQSVQWSKEASHWAIVSMTPNHSRVKKKLMQTCPPYQIFSETWKGWLLMYHTCPATTLLLLSGSFVRRQPWTLYRRKERSGRQGTAISSRPAERNWCVQIKWEM